MRLIARRGNTFGINRKDENHPDYILAALELGYDCEIDLWFIDNIEFNTSIVYNIESMWGLGTSESLQNFLGNYEGNY